MKVIVGLGNPGRRYEDTRHNVGWWALDRLAYEWDFGPFEQAGLALRVDGVVDGTNVRLAKPVTFMNESGRALTFLRRLSGFDVEKDLLVVVDDATIDVGRVRFRRDGSAGGHNGLKSVAAALGSEVFNRLRIGVGVQPAGVDLADWVLSSMSAGDEDVVTGLLPELTHSIEVWLDEGIEEAMNRFNR